MTSKERITELYVGYFDRAPDPLGLTFWIGVLDNGLSLDAIAQDFATQPEARATYDFLEDAATTSVTPTAADIEDFITAIYENLFDRLPEAAGLSFWTDVLQNGFAPGSFILAIVQGASTADAAVLANKVDVACAWSDAAALEPSFALDSAYIQGSGDALAAVTADAASVDAGKTAAALFFQAAPSVALTNAVTALAEDVDLASRLKVADIVITDDGLGTNALALTGADAALFEIDGTELFLSAGSPLDFETNPVLDVTVTVDDASLGSTPDDTAALSLTVTDANDAPQITLSNAVTVLSEDADLSAAVKVADITVSDDTLGTNLLSLSGADAALFEIDGTALMLRAGTVLDFETSARLDVTVDVDDAALGTGAEDSATLNLSLSDVNEAPGVTITPVLTSLAEDVDTATPVKVADIVISDDALGSNVLSLGGTDAALFEITGTELFLKAGVALDFETAATLDVSVSVDDAALGGSPDDTATLSLAVADVNEAPSLNLIPFSSSLSEQTATSVTRILMARVDVIDDALGTNVVTLTGPDAALFELEGALLFLALGAPLDFDTNPVLDVTVTVDDATLGGAPDDAVTFSLPLTDVNDPPNVTLLNLSSDLAEDLDTTAPVKVADIILIDDVSGTNVLGLTGADANLFEITADALFLKAGTALDFETQSGLDVTVTVDDASLGTGIDGSVTAAISVVDVNEVPSVALTAVLTSLSETADVSSRIKVADIVISDDSLGNNALAVTGANAALFEIDGAELFLKAGSALDFETAALLEVSVTVDDPSIGASPDATASFALSVTDANEPPSVRLDAVQTSLFEGTDTSARIQVATITLEDDSTGTNVLSLSGADAALFEIDAGALFLKAGTLLDVTTNGVLDVTVEVDDATLGSTVDDTVALAVTVTPGAPNLVADDTEELTFVGGATGVVRVGQTAVADADPETLGDQPGFGLLTDPGGDPYAAVAGPALSLIDVTGHDGLVSLGMISTVDGTGLTANDQGFLIDNTNSSGDFEAHLGAGNVSGVLRQPELTATGEWVFDNTGATGSMQITLDALSLSAGGLLSARNADLVIGGDIDFSVLGSGLSLDATSTLEVGLGGRLTLTVAQADALQTAGVTVFGAGTTVITGESGEDGTASTDAIDTDFGHLRTAAVDLSAVTLSAADSDGAIAITVSGATSDDAGTDLVVNGQRVAQQVTGTLANDAVTVASSATDTDASTVDVVLDLGADLGDIGDPLDTPVGSADPAEVTGDTVDLDSTFANVTISTDSGFDAVSGAFGISERVTIVVASGAEFYAPVTIGDHVASAMSSNDGTAVLEANGVTDQRIDVSAAGGSLGWTLLGNAAAVVNTHLIGSDQADIIDGGNVTQPTSNTADLMTGNAGADVFRFGLSQSTPVQPVIAPVTAARDNEILNFTADSGADDNDEIVGFVLLINGTGQVVTVDLTTIDPTVVADVETAVAASLDAVTGVSASVVANEILLVGENGASVEFVSPFVLGTVGNATTDLIATFAEPTGAVADQAQQSTVTLPATVVVGETYQVTVTLAQNAVAISAQAVAMTTSGADLAAALVTNLTTADTSNALTLSSVGEVVTVTAATPDSGGFDIAATATPGLSGTGASILGATDLSTADIITDFVTGEDKVDLNALAGAGSAVNYAERATSTAEAASFAAALTEAQSVIDGTVTYYFTTSAGSTFYGANSAGALLNNGSSGVIADQGLLFYDANSDGSVDGVVHLVGLGLNDFAAADIL